MKRIPVLVALNEELPNTLPAPYVKVITGIGKINATMAIMSAIHKYDPDTIINFGTAGSLNPVFGNSSLSATNTGICFIFSLLILQPTVRSQFRMARLEMPLSMLPVLR